MKIPAEPGFYWARNKNYKWYNLIVKIGGTINTLYIDFILDLSHEKIIAINQPITGAESMIFGHKITEYDERDLDFEDKPDYKTIDI